MVRCMLEEDVEEGEIEGRDVAAFYRLRMYFGMYYIVAGGVIILSSKLA